MFGSWVFHTVCQRQCNTVLPCGTSFRNLLTLSCCSPSNLNLRTCVWNIHVPLWNKCAWFIGGSHSVQKAIQHVLPQISSSWNLLNLSCCLPFSSNLRTCFQNIHVPLWIPLLLYMCIKWALHLLFQHFMPPYERERGRYLVDWIDSSCMQVCCILSRQW